MIKVTRWSPDTCNCVLEYTWNTEEPAETRTHTPSSIVSLCPLHSSETEVTQHHNKIKDENTRKNNVLRDLRDNYPELCELDESGTLVLKKNVVSWIFNEQRVLEVTITGLTANQKTNVQNIADSVYGVGKVLIL